MPKTSIPNSNACPTSSIFYDSTHDKPRKFKRTPETIAEVFRLHYRKNKSQSKIAKLLGCSQPNISYILHDNRHRTNHAT